MKILILGHRGMLGSDLMLRLAAGHEVEGRDVDTFDITSEADCGRVVEETSPGAVINATGYTNVDGAETDRDRCFAVNATGVKNLALACRGRGVTLVHFSTDYVFDGRKSTPYVEQDEPAPLSVYGASKLAGEHYLQSLGEEWLLIRTAWLFGRHGRNFVRAILDKTATEKTLEVVHDQIGSPTHTWDLAGAVELLISGGQRGIFHAASRGRCSWYEFACKILQIAGRTDVTIHPIGSDRLLRPAVRPAWSVLSGRKLYEACGRALPPWQVALQDYLERMECRR